MFFHSGESGAGKTESAKLLISQLVELSKGTSQLEQQILQVSFALLFSFFFLGGGGGGGRGV